MRLIHTRTKKLKWYEEEDRPPYAILSHRWGDTSEEVTLQEFEATLSPNPLTPIDPILLKSGYKKIQEFCKEADRMKYDWAWIDTCCIDKTSSSELSEAINCMYRWYEQSALCIAYLESVEASSINLTYPTSEFRESKWFTRGWTLQELIAPRKLLFYNKSWTFIDDRSNLAHSIEQICGVPHKLLSLVKKPSEYSIAQRMSWAAKRVTARREDRAYCLLGLFEINMPLIYGEGDAAFQRLQKKIIKKSNDQTIFAWGFCLPDEMVLSPRFPQLMSILADSPAQFEGCGDIVPYHSNSLSIEDGSYQLAKDGIHMAINCREDLISSDESRFIALLFCTREKQKSRIGIRLQTYTVDEKPVPYSTWFSSFLFHPPDESRKSHTIMGRIAGCRPLEDTMPRTLTSYCLPEAFLAINPPYSLDQTPGTERVRAVTISPYGTVIIPDLEGLTFRPLPSESRAQIISHKGYFAINKRSESHQAQSPFEAFFACSLVDHGTAHADSTALYMMIDDQRMGRLPRFSLVTGDRAWRYRARCRFAKGELETGNLSAERLRSLSWTPTVTYHNTTMSTRETHRQHQSDVSFFSFALNGGTLEPPHAIVELFRTKVPKAPIHRYFQETFDVYLLMASVVAAGVFPFFAAVNSHWDKRIAPIIFIYLTIVIYPVVWSYYSRFVPRFRQLKWVVLLFPLGPVLGAGLILGF
ncbi:heterokaryon incompatibility protein-domain-containing protein [Xylaria acuta]|nr:heterokaryon incompatibility protein-domain-containing protein [Xylaria acuta]